MSASPLALGLAAQQPSPAPGPDIGFFLMMGAVFAIFYFLVIRPQQRKQRALEDAVKSAAKGDQVVTSGGLHGKIVAAADDHFTVEIATLKGGQAVRVQVARNRIDSVTSRSAAAEAGKSAGQEKGEEKGSGKGGRSGKEKDA